MKDFYCTYLKHVYEINEVKLILQKLHVYFTSYENLNIEYKIRLRVLVRIVHEHVLVHVKDLNLSIDWFLGQNAFSQTL